ncbi:P-loop containing nucleoside triphosphate hydrolase protein [Punctularia strigosozonata HHB-11173 SS5]|uniref:P-loop containing nucleoside triphosphate hydrolase protein n=1 Tax=Punctularia strigosozonata (strain HHB-11173) TaxID=741275 RepID=UPI00044179CC|nr:P-loop containing nucleoside triphosphate hydrolase protein [Punctularia strigosozonata HHB-11173 SS5]EIN12716.1 P-loop containing nucleoside triphosphate hydrolase protein [Punctularia strigosozonata HHB-11173 SS5]
MSSTNRPLENQARPSSGKKGDFLGRRSSQPEDEKPANVEVPQEDVEPKVEDAKPVSFTDLFRLHTKTELTLNLIGLVCAMGAGAAQPLMSLFFGNLTEDFVHFATVLAAANSGNTTAAAEFPAVRSHFRHTAANDASFLVYIGVAMFVATYVYMVVWVYTGEVNAKRLRERYLRAVLRQDIAYFDNLGAGEVATRIQTDTHLVQEGISEKVALIVVSISAFITGFILAYVRNWRLALALTSIIPCISIAGGVMNAFMSKYMQISLKHIAEGGTLAEEVISNIRTAQAFGTQPILSSIYGEHVNNANKVELKDAAWQGGGVAVFFFIIYSSYALAFDFGTTLINEHHANAGQVVNVSFAILIGSFSLAMLMPDMQAISYAQSAAAKLHATIDRIPSIDSADPGGTKLEKVVGEIALEHVYFNYPSRPNVPVVKDLNLTFPAGKTCALVGASGSGKSTCIGLIERFYDPLSGVVKFDGVDIKELNLKWLRSQIGLVSQEPTLFATTIKGNVAHGLIGTKHEHASQEEKDQLIKEACIKANADGFIAKLPLGYDTMVGERGFLLSGGQKQRIAIARAIVSDPKILLLDEATSALDTQSEGIVQNALDKAAEGRTTITIAHRLSTIKDADCIYVMGGGVVLEKGTHQELLKNEDGAYSRLVAGQKLREAREGVFDVTGGGDPSTVERAQEKTMEQQAAEDIPLGRKQSGQSLGSQIGEQHQRKKAGPDHKDDYSLLYLLKRMGIINRENWKWYGIAVVAACCSGAVYPSFGIVLAHSINNFSKPDPHVRRERGDRDALWFFVIAILSTFSLGIQNYLFASTAASLTAKLRSLSFKAILRQDIEFFDEDENNTGAVTSSLSDNPQKVNDLAGVTLGVIVQSFATLVVGLVLGLVFAWKLGLVGLACMPLLVSAGYIRLRVVVLKDQKNKRAHEDSVQLACEAAGAIRTVASLTREHDCTDLYNQSLEGALQESNRSAIRSNLLFALSQSMSFYIIALIFWYGSRLVSDRELSTTDFFIGLMGTVFGSIQAGNVFSYVPDMSSAKGAGSDIIRLLDSVPEIDAESTVGKVPKDVKGQIRLEDIHFRYPTRPAVRVLRGLNLTVDPGTYVALVGASGCGKSTTIQLVERFYDPLAGHIYLDGQDIAELNVQEYRKHIALVSQEPTLYAGTVRFNILLGATKPHEEVTQEDIEEVCRNANILDFIQSLPDGFDTEVGGKGSQLSGGQKQRIAIARALLRNPKVLLLDEATSALDSQSEKVVQAALDQAAKGRTTIAIAHRLSTIQNADCIYFVKDGAVSEYGTHDQLIAKKGDYYASVRLQSKA